MLRLEGGPRDLGYQHGSTLAEEIDDAISALKLAATQHHVTWDSLRETSKRLFWDRMEPEYRDEMAGIAEGLKARGRWRSKR